MTIPRLAVSIIALLMGGWLLADGTRAFATGDYFTPRSGPGAGQLGPWSRVVSALGFAPRSTLIKSVHIVLGVAWILALLTFHLRPAAGWWTLLFTSLASLWYLPLGTVLSLLELGLLALPSVRQLP